MRHIASVSFGKDSLAMVLMLIEKKMPLDEVVFYDTGMEFQAIYNVLDRVSCWCCCNKNRKELKNIYLYLPDYWEKLKYLQSRLDRPMKRFCNKKHGEYGNLFDMEKVFEHEKECGK